MIVIVVIVSDCCDQTVAPVCLRSGRATCYAQCPPLHLLWVRCPRGGVLRLVVWKWHFQRAGLETAGVQECLERLSPAPALTYTARRRPLYTVSFRRHHRSEQHKSGGAYRFSLTLKYYTEHLTRAGRSLRLFIYSENAGHDVISTCNAADREIIDRLCLNQRLLRIFCS